MTRWNGSLIGVQKNTSLTDSTGVWNLRRQTLAKQNGVWPLDNSTIPQTIWSLDFSSGEPWSNGTDYTFVSTASTSRTFVNSSGFVAPSVANLVVRSEEFNTSWTLSRMRAFGSGSTANAATAPDGTTTADLITEDSTSGPRGLNSTTIANQGNGTSICISVYAKKPSTNGRNVVGLSMVAFGIGYCGKRFDLTTGTVVGADYNTSPTDFTNLNYGISDAGNGWYRCHITVTINNTANMDVRVSPMVSSTTTFNFGFGDYAGDNTSGILIWGAQCVTGTAPLPYSATTSSSNGIPRLTHNSSGSRLGLLVEEQRANLFQRSGELTNAYWNLTAVTTATVSVPVAPDNSTNAVEVKETTANSAHDIGRSSGGVVVSTNTTYSVSVFLKKNNRQYCGVYAITLGPSTSISALFDLDNGTVADSSTVGTPNATTAIENYGNGWYRCTVTMTTPSTVSANQMYPGFYLSDRATLTGSLNTFKVPQYAGSTSNSVYIWGAQLEVGATVSSYIPTTTASVTRNEDKVHITKSKITNWSSPGAVCVHFYKPLQAGTLVSTDDAATEQLGIQASSTTAARAFWSSGQTATGDIGEPVVQKAIHYWDGTTSKFCINGTTVQTGTNNVSNFNNTNFITLGAEATDSSGSPGTFSNYANCIIRKVEFYAGSLTDTNLQEITQGDAAYPIEYLVVAGGGGGGGASGFACGGGGGGGYKAASGFFLTQGTSYTITVGAGGAGGSNAQGTAGSNSVFSTVISTGGGGGGGWTGSALSGPSTGGSGGGGAGQLAARVSNGATGTSGEGNAGGNGNGSDSDICRQNGGGGGGSGGVGANASNTDGGNGGAGSSNSIDGSAKVFGSGGGGGKRFDSGLGCSGVAGTGGTNAGNGSRSGGTPGNGTANCGGGGGGYGGAGGSGGSGGSGVVILRIPTARYSGVHTGAPSVSQVGDETVLVFNSSGSYKA